MSKHQRDGNTVDILFNKKVVGERSLPQAIEELHENAIYFLSGKRYQVKKLQYDPQHTEQPYNAELISIPSDYPYYTRAMVGEWPNIIEIYEQKMVFGIQVKYCLKIQKKVTGYTNIEIGQEVTQGRKVMFSEPIEFEFITKGFVFRAPRPLDILKDANDEDYVEMSGYHASVARTDRGKQYDNRWSLTRYGRSISWFFRSDLSSMMAVLVEMEQVRLYMIRFDDSYK